MKIVFDFGGVVFDWHPPSLLQRELPHLVVDGATAAHWEAQIFQNYRGDWGDFDRGVVEPAALVQRIAARTGLGAADVQRVVDGVPRELQPKAETVALLRRLHGAGHDLYYLSNMPEPYAVHLESTHDFFSLFQAGVFSSRVQHNKPAPEIYQIAAQRFGQPPQQLVFLDDTLPNVEAARSLGWNALHFTSAAQAEAQMRERGWIRL
jgi:putative hydrolase of the HAD superfamily